MKPDRVEGRLKPASVGLFRQEAIEYRAGHRLESDVLRLGPGGRRPGRLLLAAMAAAVAYAASARLPARAGGPAVVVGSTRAGAEPASDAIAVVAALPEAARPSLAPGTPLEFRLEGGGRGPSVLTVESVGIDPGELPADLLCSIRARAFADGLGDEAVLVRARPRGPEASGAAALPPGGRGRAQAALEPERLLFALFPDLERVWPHGRH